MLIDNLDLRPVKEEKPSLKLLSNKLRHPEEWPLGFKWNYLSPKTCAIGLATSLWWPESTPTGYLMAKVFNIPNRVVDNLFFNAAYHNSDRQDRKPTTGGEGTQPDDVAWVIDKYLDGKLVLIGEK